MTSKVYFPIESLVGLGHFNRAGKIVREMITHNMDVTVASGTFVDPDRFFKGAHQQRVAPYVFQSTNGAYYNLDEQGNRSIVRQFNQAAWTANRTAEHIRLIQNIRPDIFVSEFWPFNRDVLDTEMLAMLSLLRSSSYHALRVASIRDVMDTPQETASEERKQKQLERDQWVAKTVNENFDVMLVHGDQKFISLQETFSAADQIKIPVIYTGYILADLPLSQISPGAPKNKLLVSCGSGVDGDEMIFSFLTAWQKLMDRPAGDIKTAFALNRPIHIVCGPRFNPREYDDVVTWAKMLNEKGADITVEKYRQDFTSLLAGAGFSLSLAGYNTTLETLALRVPHLFVPKYSFKNGVLRASTEQAFRLSRLQEHGVARYADPADVQNSNLFADRLADEIWTQVGDRRLPATINTNGAVETIAVISALAKQQGRKTFSF